MSTQSALTSLRLIIAAVRAALMDPTLEDAECCDKIRDILKR